MAEYAADFRFLVVTGKAGGSRLRFSKISGLECSMEYEEIVEGGRNGGPHIVTAPHRKHSPLVLEHGILPEDSWLSKLRPGMRLGTSLTIILLDAQGKQTKRKFWVEDGIVTKWEAADLDALGSSVLIEKFELLHDGIHYSGQE
ncbi:MAG: phage tail protein [Muribaculaceae bacterium]|nr:phage tail protein [Roseburia sp.]MCM1431878.1 phage tail protein [Muribaculaceae bacterium]MCM1493438.1 phage tail protein [Muribaculaceae bacterium]